MTSYGSATVWYRTGCKFDYKALQRNNIGQVVEILVTLLTSTIVWY